MKLLLYCPKANRYDKLLVNNTDKRCIFLNKDRAFYCDDWERFEHLQILNGKVIGECDFEVEEIKLESDEVWNEWFETSSLDRNGLLEKSCLTEDELYDYLYKHIENGKNGYAIHIKNLKIFDKPKEVSNYLTFDGVYKDINNWKSIKKAPQNMMYAYEFIENFGWGGMYRYLEGNILISIHPEYLCKILNGEKTIELRKKVLRGMLNNGR